jgi:hypothetical protein
MTMPTSNVQLPTPNVWELAFWELGVEINTNFQLPTPNVWELAFLGIGR